MSNSGVLTKELETEKILIYPNPIKNINLVNFNSKETGEINIYNSVGQKVLTQKIESIGNQTISVEKLEVGTYFVQMVGKEKIYIGKIIKE
ncbi:MAG: T9SS type A sorting domain-containing protein [Saprospiraceae bacterium]|nr:T9SS type A sorting domain-containing protein [Saprospiraceae bacterium]